jgi:glyoxylase-like metal-dependent hydrolase (beta-lactamase superfamily II)
MGVDIYGHSKINRKEEELEETKKEYRRSIINELRKKENEEEIVFYNTRVVNPNVGISSNMTIDLGGITAEIILTPGHTKMNLSIYIREEEVLFCGDAIVTDYLPNLEDGDKNDWREWLSSLEKIKSISPKIIVPGHGEIMINNKIGIEINRISSILRSAIENKEPQI